MRRTCMCTSKSFCEARSIIKGYFYSFVVLKEKAESVLIGQKFSIKLLVIMGEYFLAMNTMAKFKDFTKL